MAYNGWKVGLPDKFWPVTLDNFFENPDEIRELGLRMIESDKTKDVDGQWPGYRSEELWKTDEGLTQRITEKILSCYFNLDFEQVFWNYCTMQFHLISSVDKDKNNTKNKGWIHRDGKDPRWIPRMSDNVKHLELTGLIYLTPDIERDTGTSLFVAKKDKTLEDWNKTTDITKKVHLGKQDSEEEIKEKWEKHRSCFIEKVRFENIYNRLIMYDSREWHAANSYYTSKDNRLTLTFFIGGIRANKWPLQRVKEIKC